MILPHAGLLLGIVSLLFMYPMIDVLTNFFPRLESTSLGSPSTPTNFIRPSTITNLIGAKGGAIARSKAIAERISQLSHSKTSEIPTAAGAVLPSTFHTAYSRPLHMPTTDHAVEPLGNVLPTKLVASFRTVSVTSDLPALSTTPPMSAELRQLLGKASWHGDPQKPIPLWMRASAEPIPLPQYLYQCRMHHPLQIPPQLTDFYRERNETRFKERKLCDTCGRRHCCLGLWNYVEERTHGLRSAAVYPFDKRL